MPNQLISREKAVKKIWPLRFDNARPPPTKNSIFEPAKAALVQLLHANHLPVQPSPGVLQFDQQIKSTWSNDLSRSPHGYPLPSKTAVLNLIKVEHDGYTSDSIQKNGTNESSTSTLKEFSGTVLHQASLGFNFNMF